MDSNPINAPIHSIFCPCPLCVDWVERQNAPKLEEGNDMEIIDMNKDVTAEELIDAAEVLAIVRRKLAEAEPHGAYSEHTANMDATYKAERLLRWYAGER